MAKLRDYEIEEQFKEMLDEYYPVVTLLGMEYSPSYALRELDPIAYRCALSDYEGTEECPDCSNVLADCECAE